MKTKITRLLVLVTAISFSVACTNNTNRDEYKDSISEMDHTTVNSDEMHHTDGERASATISSTVADTTGSGLVEFSKKTDGRVEMSLTIKFPKLANKSVAVHLHEHGDCGDQGKGAHGHWNPTNEPHGKWGAATHHSGDIGNIPLDGEGNGSIIISSNRWTIGGDEKTNIINRAVIVHSGVDDYSTQPTGNSGSRIGCGVIAAK